MNAIARPATRGASLQAFGRQPRCAASLIFSITLCVLACCVAGCGGSKIEAASSSGDVSAAEAPVVETELRRAALDELLAKGPAYALAMVQIDPAKKDGKFVGFRIVSFRSEIPAYLDLRPGDVVTRINDLPIERPEQFFAVFEVLRTAAEVKLDVLRDGAPKTITVPIVP